MLSVFGFIFCTVVLPIFIQIALGYGMQKKFRFDIRTLAKVQFYLFVPALAFTKIYESDMQGSLALSIIASALLVLCALFVLSFALGLVCRFRKQMKFAFFCTSAHYNSGNFCLPLLQLLYKGDPLVMSVQAIMMATQNVIQSTVGVFCAGCGSLSVRDAVRNIFRMPIIYACATGAALKALGIPLWAPLLSTADMISNGLVSIALFTLGAQLAQIRIRFSDWRIWATLSVRLLISPLIAFGAVRLLGITGLAAQAIVIMSAAPTAVNTLIISMEYDNQVEFTSKAVFASTVLSSVTVTAVICLVQKLM